MSVTGCTVHLATLEVDDGPILAQESVPVLPGDTADALHERIKGVERRLYPQVLQDLVETDLVETDLVETDPVETDLAGPQPVGEEA